MTTSVKNCPACPRTWPTRQKTCTCGHAFYTHKTAGPGGALPRFVPVLPQKRSAPANDTELNEAVDKLLAPVARDLDRTERAVGNFVVLPTAAGGLAVAWPAWGVSIEFTIAERDAIRAVA